MNFCALICISADFLLPSYFPIQKLEYPSREFQALLISELKKCWKFCQLCGNLAIFEKVLSWHIIQIHCASVKPVVKCQKEANECMYFSRQNFTRMPEVVVPQNIWLVGRTGWHDDSPSMPPTSPPPLSLCLFQRYSYKLKQSLSNRVKRILLPGTSFTC